MSGCNKNALNLAFLHEIVWKHYDLRVIWLNWQDSLVKALEPLASLNKTSNSFLF